jgi:2-oxoglutarate ferredoxin oxidoreductase subunit delta
MPEVIPQNQSPTPPPAVTKKGPRGEVIIYAKWCKGCHICVEFCPPKVLAMDANEDYPRIVAPEKCTACHFCDTHCPDLAIVVRKLD